MLPTEPTALEDDGTAAFDGLPGRLCLFYQPDVELETSTVAGCEALLRWWHPDFGMLRPAHTLQGTRWDDTTRIEDWAAATAFDQAATWSNDRPDVAVAHNVSRRYLLADGFIDRIDAALDTSGADPARLAIDVPVSAVATDPDGARATASALAARGITVVLDGVGVRTRLLDLETIDATVWKIDLWPSERSWSEVHPAVTEAVRRARHHGATTIAKSVEDERILAMVRDAGFERAFGHAISPALTRAAMTALLRQPRRTPLVS
jgi:EAL domain-containing protein (putative c-di-GMP-specific phosphodiesterase class I)